jgi:hypothetical protein
MHIKLGFKLWIPIQAVHILKRVGSNRWGLRHTHQRHQADKRAIARVCQLGELRTACSEALHLIGG